MNEIELLDEKIAALEKSRDGIDRRLKDAQDIRRKLKAAQFIRVNTVTLNDVEFVPDRPWCELC